jgi:hypothetical protein
MMAGSTCSNQRPDTLMQDRIARIDETSCTARPDHTFGSIVRIGSQQGQRCYLRIDPKADVNTTDRCVSASSRRYGSARLFTEQPALALASETAVADSSNQVSRMLLFAEENIVGAERLQSARVGRKVRNSTD